MHGSRFLSILGSLLLISRAAAAQDLAAENLKLMGGTGGTAFTRSCPAGSVLTGIRARVGLAIDAIGLKCRPVQANGSLGGETDVGSLAGGTGGTGTSGSCAQGSVIAQQDATGAILTIGYLRLTCFGWSASARTFGSQTGTINVITPAGYPLSNIGSDKCSRSTQPARAIRGRSGSLVDAFGLVCNEP